MTDHKTVALQKPDRSNLVPRIKTLHFTAALQKMQLPEDQMPYTEPLVADLLITYAFDLPKMFQMVSHAGFQQLGLKPEEARSIAVANLQRQIPRIGFSVQGPIRRIATGENLEACTLLADSFWDQMASEMGDLVAAVPSRDVVFFCSLHSTEGIARMLEAAKEARSKETTHALSEKLIARRGGKWEEFRRKK